MKRPRSDSPLLTLLIAFGLALGVSGIVLHMALPARYERVELIPLVVGGAIAMFGAYWKDPDRAQRASTGVVHTGNEIIESSIKFKFGKRDKDPTVELKKSVPANDPTAAPTVAVTVTQPGASEVTEVKPDV